MVAAALVLASVDGGRPVLAAQLHTGVAKQSANLWVDGNSGTCARSGTRSRL